MAARARLAGDTPTGTTEARIPPFASAWRRSHLTVDERMARGKTARGQAPRSAHARWVPAPGRPDPVALLEEQASSRVPQLVPIRYGRMLVSPFTFYRGGALIMAFDLAATRREASTSASAAARSAQDAPSTLLPGSSCL